ncbi:MAG: iron-containing alcohol dehydrogenase [Nanoarchaeota archaeon]|nr:iron-containing alcohol dehydrogenase [Nanoarchaeota archaeon]
MLSNYNPEVIIEPNILELELDKLKDQKIVLLTTKTPYKLFNSYLKNLEPKILIISKDIAEINKISSSKEIINSDIIVGFGSGTVLDVSKVISSKTQKKLIAIPTVLSCNVFATNKSTIIEEGKIKTIDSKVPDKVIIDTKIIKLSDVRYTLAGMADVLSIITAIFDWRLARKNGKEKYNYFIAEVGKALVTHIKQNYKKIFDKNDKAIEELAQMLLFSGYITNLYGCGRPESGSEHMFARAIEESNIYQKKLLHGESVILGILLSLELQGQNNVDFIYDIAKRMGIKKIFDDLSITEEDIILYLLKASQIRRERFTIFNLVNLGYEEAKVIVKKVLSKI